MPHLFLVPIVSVLLLVMSAGAQMPVDSATTSPSSSALVPAQSADGKWGYQDKSGTFTIPARYDRAERFSEGLAVVQPEEAVRLHRLDRTHRYPIAIRSRRPFL